jgi:hypothetical protein
MRLDRRGDTIRLTTDCSRRRPPMPNRSLAYDRHPTCPDDQSVFQPKRSRPCRDSQRIDEGLDRLQVPDAPHSPVLESSWCTEQSMPVGAWGWPHLERGPQRGDGEFRAAHTTTPPPSPAGPSRRGRSLAKRCQVAPFVRLVEWMSVIYRIPSVDLGCSMTGHQCTESFIQKSCVIQIRPQTSRILKERPVHGGTNSYASHAIIMPHLLGSRNSAPDRGKSGRQPWTCELADLARRPSRLVRPGFKDSVSHPDDARISISAVVAGGSGGSPYVAA